MVYIQSTHFIYSSCMFLYIYIYSSCIFIYSSCIFIYSSKVPTDKEAHAPPNLFQFSFKHKSLSAEMLREACIPQSAQPHEASRGREVSIMYNISAIPPTGCADGSRLGYTLYIYIFIFIGQRTQCSSMSPVLLLVFLWLSEPCLCSERSCTSGHVHCNETLLR